MRKKTIMAMPQSCFLSITGVCIFGIIIGSFFDWEISELLANRTQLGSVFSSFGAYLSYCLYPAAGTCLFVGLMEKSRKNRSLAWMLLIISYFVAVYSSNSNSGDEMREALGYIAGESSPLLSVAGWMIFAAMFSWVPFVTVRLIECKDPDKLIAVGAAVIIAGIMAENVNLWLKQVASRPRYKYLITLDDPKSEFRNWWRMIPYFAGDNDNYKSWPSGNMTIATMMFTLPMIVDVFKKHSMKKILRHFALPVFLWRYTDMTAYI